MSSDPFKTPVRFLKKVGPKYEELLEKLQIKTVGDLMYHFPFRYEDYSNRVKASAAEVDDVVSITGLLGKVTNITTPYGKRLTLSSITDDTGSIKLVWFNQHYLKSKLKENKTYTVSGKISAYNNVKCFFSPEVEEGEGSVITGRLVAIYPETAGISSKWLRLRNYDILKQLNSEDKIQYKIIEFLPQEILEQNSFPKITQALRNIHFPEELKDAETARSRFAFEEVFLELLKVEQRKQEWKKEKNGCKIFYKPYEKKIDELIKSLPFILTESQQKALENITKDLESEIPMNRLLEGDVGSGKTIVSLITAYLAHLNGFKTVFMAPTEILVKQHFDTFNNFLTQKLEKGIKIIQRTSGTKRSNAQDFDIAIGTHAFLFSDSPVEKLGLVIIDEQQRFGVEQRTMLLNMSEENSVPNMLSMTATPIPRTLSLTIYGDLDVSLLQPHTKTGRKVTTRVVKESARKKLYDWIKTQDQQTFIVCPFIQQSTSENFEEIKAAEKEFKDLQKILPPNQMKLIHGRMRTKDKESAIQAFRSGEIRYLISTPVIEVGIDVPDAAIIVVESAERYGLASLHQLRGRVGRTGQKGYCFLVNTGNSSRSRERLKYMETIFDGLELAEIDLKMRGQGDIFGTMQSGIVNFKTANVFDIKMLEKAKTEAQRHFPQLSNYPLLKEKIEEAGRFVGQN